MATSSRPALRTAFADEREQLWELAAAMAATMPLDQTDREIPVVVLERV